MKANARPGAHSEAPGWSWGGGASPAPRTGKRGQSAPDWSTQRVFPGQGLFKITIYFESNTRMQLLFFELFRGLQLQVSVVFRINSHCSYSSLFFSSRTQFQAQGILNNFSPITVTWLNCFRLRNVMISKRMVVLTYFSSLSFVDVPPSRSLWRLLFCRHSSALICHGHGNTKY